MDRPKLTKADLHEIKLRGWENPEVVALLFEIRRLRKKATSRAADFDTSVVKFENPLLISRCEIFGLR